MLILAGVSLNATVGENGILTKAQEAVKAQKLAQTKEELEYMFFDYNVGNSENDIATWLESQKNEGKIDEFTFWKNDGEETFSYLITKNGTQFYVAKNGNEYYATQTQTNLDSIGAGITIATQSAFDESSGNMTFNLAGDEKSTLYFAEVVSGEFNFDIKGGIVDIYITQDMNLTNAGVRRAAIDIAPGATLNLHISEGKTLNVDSGYAVDALLGVEGQGGYAGIHVPSFSERTTIKRVKVDSSGNAIKNVQFEPEYEYKTYESGSATLNVYGKGTLIARGGNASDGAIPVANRDIPYWYNQEGAGGGGAGAGIGGNGGNGGSGVHDPHPGMNGENGENCGNVNIYNSVTVYAYGGAGGSGGYIHGGSAAGGGGYPAAGIGGGGAGRWLCYRLHTKWRI